jgi:hypothetical protein
MERAATVPASGPRPGGESGPLAGDAQSDHPASGHPSCLQAVLQHLKQRAAGTLPSQI